MASKTDGADNSGVQALRRLAVDFVSAHPLQRGEKPVWRSPLLATAPVDRRFEQLRDMAAPDHLHPRDLLEDARSVVVFFVPFVKSLAEENHPGPFPCRNWGLAYQATNQLIERLSGAIRDHLEKQGHRCALTPATHNFDPRRLMARWSHKHLAYLCRLGKFGINAQFITPAGCAGRLGSLTTTAPLGDNPLVDDEELCLYKRGQDCLQCVSRCPVQAVTLEGIDRQRCWQRLIYNLEKGPTLSGLENTTHVCGKCQVNLPCSLAIPQPN
jgi:epoxyqueuosine reductase QueG